MKATTDWPDIGERGLVRVSLSRRNLTALLHMLDTRCYGQPGLLRMDDETVLVVTAEEDADHYDEREAGRMSWEGDK